MKKLSRRWAYAAGSAAILFATVFSGSPSAASGPDGSRPPFALVKAGRPTAVIVIPRSAGAHERRAAEILQSSVRKMTGAVLRIRTGRTPGRRNAIAIGFAGKALPTGVAKSAAALGHDGFLVATSGRNLYITGGGHKGAIYGVVHLLEKHFDCRKYSPSVEVFPRNRDLSLGPVFETESPANNVRIVYGEFARDPDYRDWLRLDVQDELYGPGYYVHTFDKLVPWQDTFAAHPEYFAWMNGKRIIDQLCLSRPEVFDLVVSRLEKEMAAQPDKKIWSVSQNDNLSYCQCPECAKVIEEEGSPAGPIIRFVNRVAARFPDKIISTLAYQYSRQAPRLTRPAENVQVMLCTIELNRSLPIADDPSSRPFLRDIEDWARICRNIYLWDYTVNFSHHVSPFPNLHVLQPNIRLFVGHGVRQHFQQTNTSPGHEFSELKGYLLARLLWNPDADVGAVMDEFLAGYYGAAGPAIRQYIDALKGALERTGARLDIYESPVAHADGFLSAADVERYGAIFDGAEAAVKDDSAILERVRTARLPLQYAMLEIGKNDMFGPRGFYVERDGRFEARPAMTALLEDFIAACRAGGVLTLSESGLTPEAYYDAVKRFIDVQVEGNLAFRKPVAAEPPPALKYGKGDLAALTNGVRGASDFKVHWLGWEGVDFTLTLDLGQPTPVREISLSTLSDESSWILHPASVACSVSADGTSFREAGTLVVEGDHRGEETTRPFVWKGAFDGTRYVRFRVEGTKRLPDWHPSAGGASWVFVDEIVVRHRT